MNKKYLPSALILYLNYFIHGVGCSILGQAAPFIAGRIEEWFIAR